MVEYSYLFPGARAENNPEPRKGLGMLVSSDCRTSRTIMAIMVLLMPLLGCTLGRQPGPYPSNQVFPPDQRLPLSIAITTPRLPFSHSTGHQSLLAWNDSPGQRRQLMNCTWNEGLQNFVQTVVPGTEIIYLGSGRDPLAAFGTGVTSETDTLGVVTFNLEGGSALDLARQKGWTHLVVPEVLQYNIRESDQTLQLTAPVAVIDVLEQKIVWQGVLDSELAAAKKMGPDDFRLPALTQFETTSYRFIINMLEIFERPLNQDLESRHGLASPCQEPPPLLLEES